MGDTFCFQDKAWDSIHIDVEQLLEGQQWKFVLVVVIGVINKLIDERHGNPQQLICILRIFVSHHQSCAQQKARLSTKQD